MISLSSRYFFIIPMYSAVFVLLFTISINSDATAAPGADLWPRWQAHQPESLQKVDHSPWDTLLDRYLITNHPSGINRFRYADVTQEDRRKLSQYLATLQEKKISLLNRKVQQAYWINIYNALTVQVVLDHYPVESIKDIDISPGFFSNGPWDAKLLKIEGEDLSLNDVEHRILRPIFKDNRLHYALNCASLGCPNLQPVAFTAANAENLLEKGAQQYINSPRGAHFIGGRLTASSIYKWFQEDFGGSKAGVIQHLRKYAEGELAEKLRTYTDGIRYEYDWNLNAP